MDADSDVQKMFSKADFLGNSLCFFLKIRNADIVYRWSCYAFLREFLFNTVTPGNTKS